MALASHDQSTAMLGDLLQRGITLVNQHSGWQGAFRLGPSSFTILSNSESLYTALTRCLLPGGMGNDASIFVLSGSHAPFESPPPWNIPHTDGRHLERLHIAPDGSLTAAYNPDFRQWLIFNHHRRQGLLWMEDDGQLPPWEQGSPFKTMLNWHIAPSSTFMVHAGAVGAAEGGCLLIGQGGSGKSTTVAACFENGMNVCGDDLILVDERPSGYTAWGLYDSVKLDPAGGSRMPGNLATAPFVNCVGKRLFRYTDIRPDGFVANIRLHALVRCVIAHLPRTTIVAESRAAMQRSLAPPTVFLLRGREEAAIPKIARMVRNLPCYRLELGRDPMEAASCLEAWLKSRADDVSVLGSAQ